MRTTLRRAFAGLGGLAVVAASLPFVLAPSANAAISTAPGPVYPYGNGNEILDVSTGLVIVPAGMTYRLSLGVNIQQASDLLPVVSETVFGIGGFSPTVPDGLTVTYPTNYYWSTSGDMSCQISSVRTATVTVAAGNCAQYLSGSWGITVKNTTGSNITWDLPTESARLSINGSNIDKTTVGFVDNYSLTLTDSRQMSQAEMAAGAPLTGTEGTINFSWSTPCFDAAVGDTLDIVYTAKLDGVDVSNTAGAGVYIEWTVGMWSMTPPTQYTVTAMPMGTLSATLHNITGADAGKRIQISLDFKKAGNSVTGECSYTSGPPTTGYPTLGALSTATQANVKAMLGKTSAPLALPTGTIVNDNSGFIADPAGGIIQWGVTGSTVKLVNLGAVSAKSLAGAASKIVSLTLPAGHRFYGVAWYGSARDKWAALSGGVTGYKLWLGNLSSSTGRSEKTLSVDEVSKMCTSSVFSYPNLMSAPTTYPTITVSCQPYGVSGTQRVVAKSTIGAGAAVTLTKLATTGDITDEKRCAFGSIGVNAKGSGNDAALIVYGSIADTPVQAGDSFPSCVLAGVTARKVTSISQAGVATTATLTQSPWGATDPTTLSFASGKAANTWIGIAKIGSSNVPFTVSATRAISKKSSSITYMSATNFSASGAGVFETVTPVAEISSSKWLLTRTQTKTGSGMPPTMSLVVANATMDPANGKVFSGQGLKVSNFGNRPAGGRALLAFNSTLLTKRWYTNFFVVSAAGKYKSSTWWVAS